MKVIEQLRQLRWTWTRIAAHYGVSEREVRRWMDEGEPENLTTAPPLVLRYAPVLVVNDTQYPHHDPALWEVTCQIAVDAEVEEIVWAGDILDLEQLSSFKFDPHKTAKASEDVEGFHRELRDPLLTATTKALGYRPDEVWLDGNHEDRYRRFLETHAALEDPDPVRFFGLEGMKYYPYGSRIGHFLTKELAVVHGWSTAKNAVQVHVRQMGSSVIHGHTHRISEYHEVTGARHLAGFEAGHMANYRKVPGTHGLGRPDWQQVAGTLVFRARRGESFNVHVLPVFGAKEERVIANNREYRIDR